MSNNWFLLLVMFGFEVFFEDIQVCIDGVASNYLWEAKIRRTV